mgnify:CR=1 FL=1
MNTNKTLIFFSTHIINELIISEYKKLLNAGNYDVIFAIDNSEQKFSADLDNPVQKLEFFGNEYKCFLFNENIHKSLNLPYFTEKKINGSFKSNMWYNGDYRFYYVRKYFPDFDYYWQVEYDIYCHGDSYKYFLDKYKDNPSDLIIQNKDRREIPETENWYWVDKTDWIYKNAKLYRSFYPLCRLSSRAVDFLYKRRLEHSEIYSQLEDKNSNRWIMCELFTATELLNNGYSCEYFDEYFYYKPEFDLNTIKIYLEPDNRLYHPVKGSLSDNLRQLKQENKELKKQVRQLSHYTISIFGIKIKLKNKIQK